MKKMITAVAIGLVGLTIAAPSHADTPSTPRTTVAEAPGERAGSGPAAGTYAIRNTASEAGAGLGVGPVPLVYPPLDMPARHLPEPMAERWVVTPVEGGYTIVAGAGRPGGDGGPGDYALIERDGDVYVSATKAPGVWSVEPAAGGGWTIGVPGQDLVATLAADDDVPQITLAPRTDSPAQSRGLAPAEDLD
ncbi:RICIN domain-containing protein [Streptomyces bacillaris]|uniref:RICIN domain-containing protein n=1 Tax=Streptomyces bacillaris TaxID=68179 RepID=UPI00363B3DD6